MVANKNIFRIISILFICVFVLASAPFQAVQAADTRFAKPAAEGSGNCSSWLNACTLQTALTGAASGQEIWVAAGTYKPSADPADRTATFQLKDGVAVYGGFAGTENNRSLRNPAANLTVLSGDIDNDDTQTPIITNITTVSGNTTNSIHVVTGATGATLDGFTITAGNANGSGGYTDYGGGMWNNNSSPVLKNLALRGNAANYGAGMLNYGGSNPSLTNVTFSGNAAVHNGGGLFNSYSDPILTNVTISGNTAANWGGGLLNDGNPTMTNVTFAGNSAAVGGGIYTYGSRTPHIYNTILWGNTAADGAQVYNDSGTPILSNSIVQAGCPVWSTCTNIITGNPNLGTLGDYGGFTQTIPLLAGSSAIDATSANCPTTDERGAIRSNPICDIGAYEVPGILMAAPGGKTSGLCESWADACELRYALTSAASGQEIWVAAGTYKPGADPSDRSATFQLKAGVPVYGGFAGTEVGRDQRDPQANLTILSGDIDNNDDQKPVITNLATETHNGLNSYHVVTGATGATLDGFTITAGNARGSETCPGTGCGGGMYNIDSSPTVTNVKFSGNAAYAGGGMVNYYDSSNPTLTHVTFSGNSAGWGGGIYSVYGSLTLTDVSFTGNFSTGTGNAGGGMHNRAEVSQTITNVTFSGNSAESGGGIYNYDSGGITATDATFSTNSATNGAGMFNYASSPMLDRIVFNDNTAGSYGGGMYNESSSPKLTNVTFNHNEANSGNSGGGIYDISSSPILTNVTFTNNSSGYGGGMFNHSGSNPTLTNVTFSGNNVAHDGGGLFNQVSSSPTLTNVTFSGNTAPGNGGGMYNYTNSPQVYNTIFWGNTAGGSGAQIYNDSGGDPDIYDSVVQGGYAGGTNILSTDPKLGSLGNYGGFTQTIPILMGSSAYDTGNDTVCPPTDQRGITRPQGAHCDIGAYETEDVTFRLFLPLVIR